MSRLTDNLDTIAEQIRQSFAAKDAAREKLFPLCREVVRYSSNAIRAVHRQELEPAKELLGSARNLLTEAEQAITEYSELSQAGFFKDAHTSRNDDVSDTELIIYYENCFLNGYDLPFSKECANWCSSGEAEVRSVPRARKAWPETESVGDPTVARTRT